MVEKRIGKSGSENVEVAKSSNGHLDESQEPLKKLTNFLTIEPILVIQMSTAILAFMAVQDFLFEKACSVNYGYSNEVCSALKSG